MTTQDNDQPATTGEILEAWFWVGFIFDALVTGLGDWAGYPLWHHTFTVLPLAIIGLPWLVVVCVFSLGFILVVFVTHGIWSFVAMIATPPTVLSIGLWLTSSIDKWRGLK